ncbi:MAG: hypothetical protein KBA66_18415 [Leptospiraceae bacterium]|nr:hypothetical protein [Leptospiraceae bacterium]
MKQKYLILLILLLACMKRVDWDNLDKPMRVYSYEHPHDGNLTQAEIAKNPNQVNGDKGMYRIKTKEELGGPMPNNCVSKTAKCLSNCNSNYDINNSFFALSVAVVQAKRATCYDECYNEITPGCDYPLKRIQY